jgi:hypothetical protein
MGDFPLKFWTTSTHEYIPYESDTSDLMWFEDLFDG